MQPSGLGKVRPVVLIGFNHEKREVRERVLDRPGFWSLGCGRQSAVPRKRGTLSSEGLVHAMRDAMPTAVQSPAFRRL